jgi:hypothetical protein
MHYEWTARSKDGKLTSIESITLDPVHPILAPPTLALMYCSRQVAVEAKATFYSLNTFRFAGYEAWQPMYQWLSMIGEGARDCLRNLMVEVQRPKGLIQDRHGSHEFHYHSQLPWNFRRVAFSYDSGKDSREEVDYISPAIEACLRILGKAGHALTLRLALPQSCLPGVEGWCAFWDSLAVPDQVERSRREFTANRITVLWEGSREGVGIRDELLGKQAIIEAKGWEIFDIRDGPTKGAGRFKRPTILFTARRALNACQ